MRYSGALAIVLLLVLLAAHGQDAVGGMSGPTVSPRSPAPSAPDAYNSEAMEIRLRSDAPPFSADRAKPDSVRNVEEERFVADRLTRSVQLTPAEYRRIMTVLRTAESGPDDITATFLAITIPKTFIALILWLGFLAAVRRLFRRLWDWDVRDNPIASTVLLGFILASSALVVYGVIST